MPPAACWTTVCLRRFEEEVPLEGKVEELALSHDRRLLSLRKGDETFCYSCDTARPSFLLRRPIIQEVDQNVWLHVPSMKVVQLHENRVNEFPGIPCLVALQRNNASLVFCRFFCIEGPDVHIVDESAELMEKPMENLGGLVVKYDTKVHPESLPTNTIWRQTVSLTALVLLCPGCRQLLIPTQEDYRHDLAWSSSAAAAAADACGSDSMGQEVEEFGADREGGFAWAGGADAFTCEGLKIRLCVAKPDLLVLFLDDLALMVLSFSWEGISISHCFFLQHPRVGPHLEAHTLRFCGVDACQDWIFAVTPPPGVFLLIWHITGVAFHAISLGEYLDNSVKFTSLVVALDLLGVALCDSNHDVWILALDKYFDGAPRGLDWDLLRERQRCTAGVSVAEQMGSAYQALSMFPEAFGLQVLYGGEQRNPVGNRRLHRDASVMDCLVEGVPTYGIPIPGGAFGMGDGFFDQSFGDRLEAGGPDSHQAEVEAATKVGGVPAPDSNVMRCIPYAWHERIYQVQEWLELDRPRTICRADRSEQGIHFDSGGGGGAAPRSSFSSRSLANGLNGFSIPAQHRLGDDDLHYSLCAALHRHARRQFQSCLPPWLTQTKLSQYTQAASGAGSEKQAASDLSGEAPVSAKDTDRNIAALRLELSRGLAEGLSSGEKVQDVEVGRVAFAITASHVCCEIWTAASEDPEGGAPWGLVVLARHATPAAVPTTSAPQLDMPSYHLTGGFLEPIGDGACTEANGQQVYAFRSLRRWRSLVTQNHVWYMLSEGGQLHALLLGQTPARVISNLLVFESRAKASQLCALSGWNAKQLPVLTLFLGLRFRKLEDIRQSLGLLRPDQEMEACEMIMDFIRAGYSCTSIALPFSPSPEPELTEAAAAAAAGCSRRREAKPVVQDPAIAAQLPADRSFVSRLLESAMHFITKLIQTRVTLIQECEGAWRALTYLQPQHAASEPSRYASMVHELSQLTVHMQSLRMLQQQLIRSFGDEKAYDRGISVCCPPQRAKEDRAIPPKSGAAALDAAVLWASRLQAGSAELQSKEKSAQLAGLRSAENAEAIVRGALVSGRISSALNWFHELARADGARGVCGARTFEDFRVMAGRLAYQLVCNQQLDFLFVAMHMLRNVGENVNRFFKAVAFHTSKRLVRRRLLRHVDHMGRLTKAEQSLISLVNLLERLYTNPCYTTEFNRMTTGLTTGQYPQRAHLEAMPPFYTWPAGGRRMLMVGLRVDGAIGGHIGVDTTSEDLAFEQQTSLRELPMSQRMPLELYDMWAGYQTPVMAAMLEMPSEARRAWSHLPCGDIDDLDPQPVLGLSNFHKSSNLEREQDPPVADLREVEGGEGDADVLLGSTARAATRTTCRQCRLEAPSDELDTESKGQVDPDKDAFFEALGIGEGNAKKHTIGYLHVTLGWMTHWPWDTRARIIMEKTHFSCPRLVESLEWLQPPAEAGPEAWRNCWLDFLVAHQDWRGLASWVQCMPLRLRDRVDDHGRSHVDLAHLEDRCLPCCTSYTKEVILQELSRRGIFCRSDAQSFSALLRRLAQCGRLFGDDAAPAAEELQGAGEEARLPEDGALPLDRLLPIKAVCPFHQFFIHFCLRHDLPTVMLLYLQRYQLAATMGDLKALQLRHAEKPWASLLLVGRLGNAHLFATSLHHAAAVFADPQDARRQGGVWTDAENVAFMPLGALASRSPLAFLATLMFAPVASALDAVQASETNPWCVDVKQLNDVIQDHAALHEAFYPFGGPSDPSSHRSGGSRAAAGAAPRRALGTSLVESVAEANGLRWRQAEGLRRGPEGAASDQKPAERQTSKPAGSPAKQEKPWNTLKDMTTFKEDVSLLTLLGDVAAFDVREGLRALPIFGGMASDDGGAPVAAAVEEEEQQQEESFELAALVAPEEKFRDELGEGYFLAQGRAMMAFHVLMTKCDWRMEQRGDRSRGQTSVVLPAEDARRLHKVAKSVALHNLLNEGVLSSAVCLLELCSLETEMLRVDVQAAKRIYDHLVQQYRMAGGEDADRQRAAAATVVDLFLSFPDIEDKPTRAAEAAINSGHLLTALRMLEESTWALDPHPSAPTVSSLQALAYDSPWHLVALFCRVHSLPRSLTLLHELARNNDWVMFLHESDLQQCPADTVLDIVDGYFTDVSLQSHLRILAHTIAAQEQDGGGCTLHLKVAEPRAGAGRASGVGGGAGDEGDGGGRQRATTHEEAARNSEEAPSLSPQVTAPGGKLKAEEERGRGLPLDAIGFLERCRGKAGASIPGAGSSSTGSDLLRHAVKHRIARLAVTASAFLDVTPLQCMAVWLSINTDRNRSSSAGAATGSVSGVQASPAEVAAQVALLCRKSHAFSLVLRALWIFDPLNPLVDFVKFHCAFVQCRFQSCAEHLRRFVERRDRESEDGRGAAGSVPQELHCLALVPYVTQLSEEMVQYLLDGFPRARMMLLSAVDQANFSPRYSQLFRSFRLIQQTGLDVDFRMPAGELLQLLISRKMFAEARDWARSSGIVGDTIVFEEVTGMIVEFRQGVWWNVLDERLHLWQKCYDAFLRQNYPAVGAALFFLDITSKLEPDLFAREQLVLLCIAFELLQATPRQAVATEATSKQPQAPTPDQLNRIKLSMLLILTGTNKELAAELDFLPLDLSYGKLRTLAHRIPETVTALPLYHGDGGGGGGNSTVPTLGEKGPRGSSGVAVGAGAVVAPRGTQSWLLTFLETAISSLINCDELAWAQELAEGFGFESADLRLAAALEMVASGHHKEAMSELAARPQPPSVDAGASAAAEAGDADPLLRSLSTLCSSRIALFCRRRSVFYAVARSTGMDYQCVKQIDAGELLDRLLSPRPYAADIALCKSLLACYPRPPNKAALAEVLASRFVRSTLEPGAQEWPEGKLDEFVSLLGGASQEHLGDAALYHIPNFRQRERVGGEDSGGRRGRAESVEDLGDLPFECEVEVLIMAYHAYVQACREQSIHQLLIFLRSRVGLYVEHGQFTLLVRLLVAIPEYHATEYMFGYLVRHGRLELLLELGRAHMTSAGQEGASCPAAPKKFALAVALVKYLQEHFPRNLELLVQVHRCFGMEAQLAELLEHRAGRLAQGLGRKWERICSEDGEEQLLICLSLFLQCSRFFLSGKRYQQHLVANELAALICLQLKAVQIHLAASLQEQQSAATREGAAKAVHGALAGGPSDLPVGPWRALSDEACTLASAQAGTSEDFAQPRDEALEREAAARPPDALAASPAATAPPTSSAIAAVPSPGIEQHWPGRPGGLALEVAPPPGAEAPAPAPPLLHGKAQVPARAAQQYPAPPLGPAGDPFVVINLEAEEVEVFVEYHHDFVVSFQVVNAYRHTHGEVLYKAWPRALYRQVMLLGNSAYLNLFLRHQPLTKEHLEATVKLYLQEPAPEMYPWRAQRMTQFLREGVPDLETRYQLARQLGTEFADISMETASLVYMT